MRRLILIGLALGSIWFACSSSQEADENVAVEPVAVSAEAIAAQIAKPSPANQPKAEQATCPGAAQGCDHEPPAPAAVGDRGERVLGAPLTDQSEPLTVAALLERPEPHLGKVVKATGTVSRVCEKAGCWLELASAQGGQGLRVPMANHAFFIPADAVGRTAIIQGQLTAQPLPDSHAKHLAGEGAKALGPLALAATTVVVK